MINLRRASLLAVLCFLLVLLAGCNLVPSLSITVADGYQGFLIVRYECEGGTPFAREYNVAEITFDDTGALCLDTTFEEMYPSGLHHISSVQTSSGTSVPFRGNSLDEPGYALVALQTVLCTRASSTKDYDEIYSIMWVGELEDLQVINQEDRYHDERASFARKNSERLPFCGRSERPLSATPEPSK
jgi:hypothetical protein